MQSPTRRRWPQFKLSTILVLVAILAWAMAYWPWWVPVFRQVTRQEYFQARATMSPREVRNGLPPYPRIKLPGREVVYHMVQYEADPRLAWPTLALATFLTWKLGWVIAARQKRGRAGGGVIVASKTV